MLAKQRQFTFYPAAKHQKAANLGLQTYVKNQQTLLCHAGIDFSTRNDFTN